MNDHVYGENITSFSSFKLARIDRQRWNNIEFISIIITCGTGNNKSNNSLDHRYKIIGDKGTTKISNNLENEENSINILNLSNNNTG